MTISLRSGRHHARPRSTTSTRAIPSWSRGGIADVVFGHFERRRPCGHRAAECSHPVSASGHDPLARTGRTRSWSVRRAGYAFEQDVPPDPSFSSTSGAVDPGRRGPRRPAFGLLARRSRLVTYDDNTAPEGGQVVFIASH